MYKILFLILVAVSWRAEITTAQRFSNETDQFEVASAVTAFSQDFYQKVANRTGNLLFSPLTVHSALSMVYLGAGGTTMESMEQALELMDLPYPHLAYHDLLMDLANATGVDIKTSSAIWIHPSVTVRSEYKTQILDMYDAVIEYINFTSPLGPEVFINEWVTGKTFKKITSIVPPGTIKESTGLLLINTLILNGTWLSTFDDNLTRKETFVKSDGSQIEADFMTQQSSYDIKLSAVENVDVIKIPLVNKRFAMYIALPKTHIGLGKLEDIITNENFDVYTLFSGLHPAEVKLSVPKFNLSSRINLNRPLKEIGMEISFTDAADFTGISSIPVKMSEVLQKVKIGISESGISAAKVNGSKIISSNMKISQLEHFTVDRPFMFFVYDDVNEQILLQGKLSDPTIEEIEVD